jgi:hypothetical protein
MRQMGGIVNYKIGTAAASSRSAYSSRQSVVVSCMVLLVLAGSLAKQPPTLNVCTRPSPVVSCTSDKPPTGGFEFTLFNEAWKQIPEEITSNYTLLFPDCRTYEKILQQTKDGVECNVAFGSITESALGDRKDVTFRGHSYSGQLVVAVRKTGKSLPLLKPFTSTTKSIAIVTCCLFPIALLLDFLAGWVVFKLSSEAPLTGQDDPDIRKSYENGQQPSPPRAFSAYLRSYLKGPKGASFVGTAVIFFIAVVTVQLLFAVYSSYLTTKLLQSTPGEVSSISQLRELPNALLTSATYEKRARIITTNVETLNPGSPVRLLLYVFISQQAS